MVGIIAHEVSLSSSPVLAYVNETKHLIVAKVISADICVIIKAK
jgi:hypothetical protein